MIESSKINKESFDILDSGIFALVLEDYSPKNRHEFSQMLLHGNGRNRYFDKSFQIIVAQNGDAGINQEHSGYDGHSILYLAQSAYDYWTKNAVSVKDETPSKVQPLQWELNEKTLASIKSAEKNADEFIGSVNTFVIDFDAFGKKYATKSGFSPDAFIQMAYQLAYFRLKGKVGSTYESSNTKKFYHGRTETIRSCSKDSKAFCETFMDSKATSKDKFDAFKKACETHVAISNDSKVGHGIDRHLYGMHQLAKHNVQKYTNYSVPQLYSDKAYSTMKTDMVSTSNSSGTPALDLFTFGPTSGSGFGLGYIIDDGAFHVACTSFQGEASDFGKSLTQSLKDIKVFVDEVVSK
jgi:carnitine O-acetyltransferase